MGIKWDMWEIYNSRFVKSIVQGKKNYKMTALNILITVIAVNWIIVFNLNNRVHAARLCSCMQIKQF